MTIWQLEDEAQLKKVLAEAGIPGVFASTVSPTSVPLEYCWWTGVSTLNNKTAFNRQHVVEYTTIGVFIINPAMMPKGSVLAFDYLTAPDGTGPSVGGTHRMRSEGIVTALLSGEPTGCTLPTS